MQIYSAPMNGEFDLTGSNTIDGLPRVLRASLRSQDSRKIDEEPATLNTDLLRAHSILLKRPYVSEQKSNIGILFFAIGARCYHESPVLIAIALGIV